MRKKSSRLVVVSVVALAALTLVLVTLSGYLEEKLEQSGERQALALTVQAAQFANEVMRTGESAGGEGEGGASAPPQGAGDPADAAGAADPAASPAPPQGAAAFGKIDTILVFDAATGRVAEASTEEGLLAQSVEPGALVYDLAWEMLYAYDERLASSSLRLPFEPSAEVSAQSSIDRMRAAIAVGDTYLDLGLAHGDEYYVALAPVGEGAWYVCSMIPAADMRAEAEVVSAVFTVVFVLSVACVILAIVLALSAYRRQARERAIRMRTRLYEALSDSLEFAVNLYSPADDHVTPIVAKGVDIFGANLEQLIKDPGLAARLRFSNEGARLLRRLREGEVGAFAKGEFSFTAADDRQRYVEYTVRPLSYDGRRQVLVILRDITSDRAIELSMRDAMEAAEAANRAKSEFLSRMSHEIRTPMNVILGMLKIARRNMDDPAKLTSNLDNIENASAHLLDLINEVLDISKIESGKAGFDEKPFNLRDVVRSIEDLVAPQCRGRSQTFSCALSGQVDAWYLGDAVRVRQMLVNLLANAVKYTPDGGRVELEVTAACASTLPAGYRRLTFTVSDNGIGMAPGYLEHLFEPFATEGRSRSQGTGLGMPIVKNIVSAMGGDIHVETAEGEGTTFTVVVDLRLAEEGDACGGAEGASAEGAGAEGAAGAGAEGVVGAGAAGAGGPANAIASAEDAAGAGAEGVARTGGPANAPALAPAAGSLAGARILLVEDNDLNAEIASELLAFEGAHVEWAVDGKAGLDAFAASDEGTFDAVLMDVQMPVMNGYEATRAIRALDRADAREVPIIAMSANAFADDVLASLKSGMNAHLSKPVNMAELASTLITEMARRRPRHALY